MASLISKRAVFWPKRTQPGPDHVMRRDAPDLGPTAFAEVLASLALVDRLEDKRRHAIERQQAAHRLISGHPLPLLPMVAGQTSDHLPGTGTG